jgi:hypothetical protein
MGFSYNVNVLNQKGSPAIYTDTFANRPPFGFAGRLFVANDTSAIYEDTGTSWVLIANVSSGAGTLQQVTTNGNTSNVGISVTAGGVSTNALTVTSLTPGSVPFVGTAGLVTQDNPNLFWDDTNNRLGINTNTPTNNLDIHGSGTIPLLALNNTAGNQSFIGFVNNSLAKWRIGNSSTNKFDILNVGLAENSLTISDSNNCVTFNKNIKLKHSASFFFEPGFNSFGGDSGGFYFFLGTNPFGAYFNFFNLTAARTYTYPNATGTIALTSDLSAYLPLTGGTLTGNLGGTTATFTGLIRADLSTTGFSGIFTGLNSNLQINHDGTTLVNLINSAGGGYAFRNALNTSTCLTVLNNSNVGINMSSPQSPLHIISSLGSNSIAIGESGTNTRFAFGQQASYLGNYIDSTNIDLKIQAYLSGGSGGNIFFQTGSSGSGSLTNRIIIDSSGIIQISNLAGTGSRAVLADASGNLSAPVSDISVKENIEPLKYGLNAIMQLNPIQFEFIEGYKNYGEGLQIGAIAQEVEQIIPEAVFETPSTGLKGIDYNQFHGLYIKAIQEQQKIIESLIQRIELLENK